MNSVWILNILDYRDTTVLVAEALESYNSQSNP